MKRAALERFLEIISEASRYIPAEFKAKNPQIPWRKVVDFGNVLRHGYHAVRIDLPWALYIDGEFDKIATIVAKLRNALPKA